MYACTEIPYVILYVLPYYMYNIYLLPVQKITHVIQLIMYM